MQGTRNRLPYQDASQDRLQDNTGSHRDNIQASPVKAKIHGAELIAREQIKINWDDANLSNYFYTDDDDRDTTTGGAGRSMDMQSKTAHAPKYTVVYSFGSDTRQSQPARSYGSIDDPEVDLQKRQSITELDSPVFQPPPAPVPIPMPASTIPAAFMHPVPTGTGMSMGTDQDAVYYSSIEAGNIGRSIAPRQLSHKLEQNANCPNMPPPFVPAKPYTNEQIVNALSSRSNPRASLSATEMPEPIPPKLDSHHSVESPSRGARNASRESYGSRNNSAYNNLAIGGSPSRQKKSSAGPLVPTYPTAAYKGPPNAQHHGVDSHSGSFRASLTSQTDAMQPHVLGNASRQRRQVVPTAPTYPQPPAVVTQPSYSVHSPTPQQQQQQSVSNQPTIAAASTVAPASPIASTRTKVPQPYQHAPQPIPQQYPPTGIIYTNTEEQSRRYGSFDQGQWRQPMMQPGNIHAHQLQDAVRQADELHAHVSRQSYIKRPTADNAYAEKLALAEAILSPKRPLVTSYTGTQSGTQAAMGATQRVDASKRATAPQMTDINARLKEAMIVARSSVTGPSPSMSTRANVSSPVRGASPSTSAYGYQPMFVSPTSRAGKRSTQTHENLSPPFQLARKYVDISGIARLNSEWAASPSRGGGTGINADMFLQRMTEMQPTIDEMETAKHMASRVSIHKDGKNIPSSQGMVIKAVSPSRGRQQ